MRKAITSQPHPMQPIGADEHGSPRFKENAIVRYIADWLHLKSMPQDAHLFAKRSPRIDTTTVPDLNWLDGMAGQDYFTREDRLQYLQLLGYSLGGYSELTHIVRDADVRAAEAVFDAGADPRDAKIAALESKLAEIRDGMREGVAALYEKHPDDLEIDA